MKIRNLALLLLFAFTVTANLNAQPNNKRIKFPKGEYSTTIENACARGEQHTYLVGAKKGQTMIVTIMSVEDNAVIQIVDVKTDYYLPGSEDGTDIKRWSGELPSSGDYQIIVGSTRGGTEYTLKVTIE